MRPIRSSNLLIGVGIVNLVVLFASVILIAKLTRDHDVAIAMAQAPPPLSLKLPVPVPERSDRGCCGP